MLFSRVVSRKDLSKTFLVLAWILIEPPYKWRHQFQVDLTVFQAMQKPPYPSLLSVQWRPNSARRSLAGMKVKILFCLLENSRFVLSWTLTFGYVIVYFFSETNYKNKETVISVRIASTCFDGSYWLFLLQKEIILSDFNWFSVIILSSVCYCRPKLPVNMHGPFVMLAQWMSVEVQGQTWM